MLERAIKIAHPFEVMRPSIHSLEGPEIRLYIYFPSSPSIKQFVHACKWRETDLSQQRSTLSGSIGSKRVNIPRRTAIVHERTCVTMSGARGTSHRYPLRQTSRQFRRAKITKELEKIMADQWNQGLITSPPNANALLRALATN